MTPIALIAAVARNRVIGRAGMLPWHLPQDLRRFKALTMGKPLVMGRKTFESIGRPLPGRANIVVSRQPQHGAEGVRHATNVDEALEIAAHIAEGAGAAEIMIIGGAEIYAQALDRAQRMYLTEIEAEIEGDTFFPEFERGDWLEVERVTLAPDPKASHPYHFVVLDRR